MPGSHSHIEIFCSYAHADERWYRELEAHLSLLQREGRVSIWHRRHVVAGTDWSTTIDTQINSAAVILLLISAAFLASDYCYGIEMKRALERHQINEARVIPILLRPVDWKGASFEHLQALPTNAQPITTWSNRDKAFTDVAIGIRRTLDDLTSLSRTVLSPVWNIPYQRNPFFTGREDLLSRLQKHLQAGQASALSQPQAISGLGGIGKTQIAVEYAYQHHQDYQAVLWAQANIRETLISSFVAIADLLSLPGKDVQDQMLTVQAVKTWLQSHSRWLLILDNVGELVVVREFLPPLLGGHLLLTTPAQALGGLAHRIEVDTFTPELGALFLLRRASLITPDASLEQAVPEDREVAVQISQELGGLPLALDQAGAYLEETGSRLQDYPRIYQQHRAKLLKERRGLVTDHPESVATTWALSFAHVEQKNPAVAELLRLCAFLASENIAEEMITQGASHLGPLLETIAIDPYGLNQAIEVVRAHSLVQRDPNAGTLSMHRLVQAVLRDAMPLEEAKLWVERTVRTVNAAFPDVEFGQWSVCERCMPHAQACCDLVEQYHMSLPEVAQLLTKVGCYLRDRGQYKESEAPLQRALMLQEAQLGEQHPKTASSLNNLANLYERQGKYVEAELLCQRALAICEAQLGAQYPEIAVDTLNHLANLYEHQGKYAEAELLCQRALVICEAQLKAQDVNTATSLHSLAVLYDRQDKYAEAELMYLRALALKEQLLGAQHPDTAVSLDNLARLYERQGKYAGAEPLFQRALAIREKLLGAQHPFTAISLNNLAYFYVNQGKYAEAEPLFQHVLPIFEQLLGAQHPFTATSLNNLAYVYASQGEYAEAEPLYKRALDIFKQRLDQEHPGTLLMVLKNYASLLRAMGRDIDAAALLETHPKQPS